MLDPKLAAVMNSLAPPFKGKSAPQSQSRPKTPTSPGLGAKMREETSRALERGLKTGGLRTGLEDLVKQATATLPPAANAVSLPFARTVPAGGLPALPPAPRAPNRLLRGGMKTLGLAGLGAAGALAYGAHTQNENDRRQNALIYAPMPGSVMQ